MASHRIHTRTTRHTDRTTHGRSRPRNLLLLRSQPHHVEQYWEQFITGSDDSLVIPTIKPVENGVGFAVLSGASLTILESSHKSQPQTSSSTYCHLGLLHDLERMVPRSKPARPMDLGNLGNSPTVTIHRTRHHGLGSILPARQQTARLLHLELAVAQKGDAVELPLGATAPVMTNATEIVTGAQAGMLINRASDGAAPALADTRS